VPHDSQEFMGRSLFWEASFARKLLVSSRRCRKGFPIRRLTDGSRPGSGCTIRVSHSEEYMRAFRELRV